MPHEHYQSCIDACEQCAEACERCARACQNEPNANELARCISLDNDCAAICRLAIDLMRSNSELAGEFCEMCARACDACAEECAKHDLDHCRECAEACRKCADECQRMSRAAPQPKRVKQAEGQRPH